MPCSDISEQIEFRLDIDDCLSHYALKKSTCGAPVGNESLLLELTQGLQVSEIISFNPAELPGFIEASDETTQFLYFKHLFALQAALRVYTGLDTGDPTAACSLNKVACDFAGTVFTGVLAAGPLLHKIKSCGHCGSCGRN